MHYTFAIHHVCYECAGDSIWRAAKNPVAGSLLRHVQLSAPSATAGKARSTRTRECALGGSRNRWGGSVACTAVALIAVLNCGHLVARCLGKYCQKTFYMLYGIETYRAARNAVGRGVVREGQAQSIRVHPLSRIHRARDVLGPSCRKRGGIGKGSWVGVYLHPEASTAGLGRIAITGSLAVRQRREFRERGVNEGIGAETLIAVLDSREGPSAAETFGRANQGGVGPGEGVEFRSGHYAGGVVDGASVEDGSAGIKADRG
jgi:hypothetical protein